MGVSSVIDEGVGVGGCAGSAQGSCCEAVEVVVGLPRGMYRVSLHLSENTYPIWDPRMAVDGLNSS